MIGIAEYILAGIVFSMIWFFIFKIKIDIEKKEIIKNALAGIERQEKIFITNGKEVDIKKELGLDKKPKENKKTPLPGIESMSEPKESFLKWLLSFVKVTTFFKRKKKK